MGPLDVQRFFHLPVLRLLDGPRDRCPAAIVPPFSLSFWNVGPPARVELRQVDSRSRRRSGRSGIGIVVGVDDGDRLAAAVAGIVPWTVGESDAVASSVSTRVRAQPISPADLVWDSGSRYRARRPAGLGTCREVRTWGATAQGRQAGTADNSLRSSRGSKLKARVRRLERKEGVPCPPRRTDRRRVSDRCAITARHVFRRVNGKPAPRARRQDGREKKIRTKSAGRSIESTKRPGTDDLPLAPSVRVSFLLYLNLRKMQGFSPLSGQNLVRNGTSCPRISVQVFQD